MNVCLVTPSFSSESVGGSSTATLNLIKSFIQVKNINLTVYTIGRGQTIKNNRLIIKFNGGIFASLPRPMPVILSFPIILFRLLRSRQKIDIMHVIDSYFSSNIVKRKKLFYFPIISQIHE